MLTLDIGLHSHQVQTAVTIFVVSGGTRDCGRMTGALIL